jgi:hypothetical protein
VDPRATVLLERLGMSKKSNYLIGYQTHDLPVCSRGERNGWIRGTNAVIAIFNGTKYYKNKT